MKKRLFFFAFTLIAYLTSAQLPLPYVGTPSIIPQNPTVNDPVSVVLRVVTPNLGVKLQQNTQILASQKKIEVRGCYWSGMLTATQEFVDTITLPIGTLSAGLWHLSFIASFSSRWDSCDVQAIKQTDLDFSVSPVTTTALFENTSASSIRVFPNPCSDKLYFHAPDDVSEICITSVNGQFSLPVKVAEAGYLDISDLPAGVYFVSTGRTKKIYARFIKVDGK
jgi:hypothetical protein